MAYPPIQAGHAMTAKTPLMIDGLIRGNRVKPRPQFPIRLELVALQINLKERQLENIVGHIGITEIIPQISVQLLLIAVNQLFERRTVSMITVFQQQLLVAQGTQDQAFHQPRRIVFNYAVHF